MPFKGIMDNVIKQIIRSVLAILKLQNLTLFNLTQLNLTKPKLRNLSWHH
jgi:hypothetical protein